MLGSIGKKLFLFDFLPTELLIDMNVILECQMCGKSFERSEKDYKYKQLNSKKPAFCSVSCSVSNRNKSISKERCREISGDRIKKLAGNRKDQFSSFRQYLRTAGVRSERKGWYFDLTVEYLKDIWEIQKGICPYSGLKMELPENNIQFRNSIKKASLDRIDSSVGYIKGNVEFVCVLMNFAKNTYPKEEVLSFMNELKNPTVVLSTGLEPVALALTIPG